MRRSPEEEETMFGKHLRLKRFLGGIVVTAAVAVVAVPSALSSTSSQGGTGGAAPDALARYVTNHTGDAQQVQGYRFVTDTLSGTRDPVAAQHVQPNRFTSDTIADVHGYNPNAYVSGGSTLAVAKATQDLGYGRTAMPVETGGSSGNSSSWKDIGIVSLAALLLVLMLGALRASRKDEPTVRTA
jgi:hypothetical protein